MGPTLPPPGVGPPCRHCTDDCSSAARSASPDSAPPLPLGRWANRSKASSARPPGRSSTGPLDFPSLRERARSLLIGGATSSSDGDYEQALRALSRGAARDRDSMDRNEDRTGLWSDLGPASDPLSFSVSYGRLRRIALAWATPGTDQHDDGEVASDVVHALVLLYQAGYNEHARADRQLVLVGDRLCLLAHPDLHPHAGAHPRRPPRPLPRRSGPLLPQRRRADRLAQRTRDRRQPRRQGRDPGLARHRRRRPRQARPRPERTLRHRRQRREQPLPNRRRRRRLSPRRLLHPARPRTEHRQLRTRPAHLPHARAGTAQGLGVGGLRPGPGTPLQRRRTGLHALHRGRPVHGLPARQEHRPSGPARLGRGTGAGGGGDRPRRVRPRRPPGPVARAARAAGSSDPPKPFPTSRA